MVFIFQCLRHQGFPILYIEHSSVALLQTKASWLQSCFTAFSFLKSQKTVFDKIPLFGMSRISKSMETKSRLVAA